MVERKMVTGQGHGLGIGGCKKLCNQAMTRLRGDTTSYTHQYPNHIPAQSPFSFPPFYIFRVIII